MDRRWLVKAWPSSFTRRTVTIATLLLVLASTAMAGACGDKKTNLRVICATSLMVPFEEMGKEFQATHPDVSVLIEGHGSIEAIRYVTELNTKADVLAVADYTLIPMMMYGNQVPGTDRDYADWFVNFATNRLGLAYTAKSKHADQIDASNWYDILAEPGIKVGVPDPNIDAAGYRALMVCQLAQAYYDNETLFDGVLGSFSPPVTVTDNQGTYLISVPEVLRPTKVVVRGSSVALLGLLQSGDIDYAFEYESVAKQQGLGFVQLPPQIDLSSPDFAVSYAHVMVSLLFQRFASIVPQFVGQPIVYALTIPANSQHPDEAAQFAEFVLGTDGQRVLTDCYQPTLAPVEVNNPDNIPAELKTSLGTG